ncbi:L,D-transpeptidase [Devosia sp.]|uniref:L,D-transpeptidase n=1 Tax=Devosia sp. TaxID=1871048 RepID=UPI003262E7F1
MALMLSVLVTAAMVAPSAAAVRYNADTNEFEQVTYGTGAHKGSPIKRQVVDYETKYRPGTVIVDTAERRLYFVLPDGQAVKYGVGVGRDGFRWSGEHHISRKAEWPGWTPPAQMRKRVPDLPAYMPGGPDNPLGARAMYIGSTLYRLHGTSEPWSIGQAVSSGCIRLTNEDVVDLYDRVSVGALVVVKQ